MTSLIEAHVAHLRREEYAAATIRDAERLLRHADAHLPFGVEDVYPDEIRDFLHEPLWSVWTVRNYDTHLRRFYAWADIERLITRDPMADIKRPPLGVKRPKPASVADFRRALDLSPEPWRSAILLAGHAGLRADEIARLERPEFTEEFVTVRRGKGGRSRDVDTAPDLWRELGDGPPGHLVTNRGQKVDGRWLSCNQRYHFVERIKMPHLHLHRFRHMFATELFRQGVDARTVQELMGHADLATTMGYAEVATGQRRRAICALSAALGRGGTQPA